MPFFEVASGFDEEIFRIELEPESKVHYGVTRGHRLNVVTFEGVAVYYANGDQVISSQPFHALMQSVKVVL